MYLTPVEGVVVGSEALLVPLGGSLRAASPELEVMVARHTVEGDAGTMQLLDVKRVELRLVAHEVAAVETQDIPVGVLLLQL